MRSTAFILALPPQTAVFPAALAQAQGCPNPCPEGQIYSAEECRCVTMTPMV